MPIKSICDCDNPPGGRVECEPHQMAICIVLNGVAHTECRTPPQGGNAIAWGNWALSQVTRETRAPDATISLSDLQTLRRGRFRDPKGAVITFALPEGMFAELMASAWASTATEHREAEPA
jgi:hypothetical protein